MCVAALAAWQYELADRPEFAQNVYLPIGRVPADQA